MLRVLCSAVSPFFLARRMKETGREEERKDDDRREDEREKNGECKGLG